MSNTTDFPSTLLHPSFRMAHLWDLGPQVLVLPGVLQEVDQLLNLQFGLLTACDVFESNTDVLFY